MAGHKGCSKWYLTDNSVARLKIWENEVMRLEAQKLAKRHVHKICMHHWRIGTQKQSSAALTKIDSMHASLAAEGIL